MEVDGVKVTSLKLKDLKEHLRKRKLKVSGKKVDLVNRLTHALCSELCDDVDLTCDDFPDSSQQQGQVVIYDDVSVNLDVKPAATGKKAHNDGNAIQANSSSAISSHRNTSHNATNTKTSSFQPTAEQEQIYATLLPPTTTDTKNKQKHIVRITAGAGAGKTTTVLQLAVQASLMGHSHITYVTFSKAAAEDGKRRIEETLMKHNINITVNTVVVEARTLHSCAMRLLSAQRNEDANDEKAWENRLLNDGQLEALIAKVCDEDIEDFLSRAQSDLSTNMSSHARSSYVDKMKRQVIFFVRKTLHQFCMRNYTPENLEDRTFKQRDYFPAKKFHLPGGDGEKHYGMNSHYYEFKFGAYADMACKIWHYVEKEGIRAYDLEMKRAQLLNLQIPGTLLLVDESQDMDECQTTWIANQAEYGTHVYLVGDAAQTIYSFRGAKSKYMMGIDVQKEHCCQLTKSWRFGSNIAAIANVILFVKQFSPQTSKNTYMPIWSPYRLVGCDREGSITDEPLLSKWKEMPVTVIAATNATLLLTAVQLFGMNISENHNGSVSEEYSDAEERIMDEEEQNNDNYFNEDMISDGPYAVTQSQASENESHGKNATDALTTNCISNIAVDGSCLPLPKIHINGKGENSGLKKWKKVFQQITHLLNLYMTEGGTTLPRDSFPEFEGALLTWASFKGEVENRELDKYMASVNVVDSLKEKTMEAMELFEREVMEKKYEADEADVILTTVHAAKGMEWDNVEVCDDVFNSGADFNVVGQTGPIKRDSSTCKCRASWEFSAVKEWGDGINMIYVALTRAKTLLYVPPSIKRLLIEFDTCHELIREKKLYKVEAGKNSSVVMFGSKKEFTCGEIMQIYKDLVQPLRDEHKLSLSDTLKSSILNDCIANDPEVATAVHSGGAMNGDEDFEAYLYPACQSVSKTEIKTGKMEDTTTASIWDTIKTANDSAPRGCSRPYDKIEEVSSSGKSAKCRSCGDVINHLSPRIGVQVYQPQEEVKKYWLYWFHSNEQCFPKERRKSLRIEKRKPKVTGNQSKRKRGWYRNNVGYNKRYGYSKHRRNY